MSTTTQPRARYQGRRVEVRVGHAWQTVGYLDPPDAPNAVAAILAAISQAVIDDRLERCHTAAELDATHRVYGIAAPAPVIAEQPTAAALAARAGHVDPDPCPPAGITRPALTPEDYWTSTSAVQGA